MRDRGSLPYTTTLVFFTVTTPGFVTEKSSYKTIEICDYSIPKKNGVGKHLRSWVPFQRNGITMSSAVAATALVRYKLDPSQDIILRSRAREKQNIEKKWWEYWFVETHRTNTGLLHYWRKAGAIHSSRDYWPIRTARAVLRRLFDVRYETMKTDVPPLPTILTITTQVAAFFLFIFYLPF
jgi:hypothetical protein